MSRVPFHHDLLIVMGLEERRLRGRTGIDSVKAQVAARNRILWTRVAELCECPNEDRITPPREGVAMIKAGFELEKETKNTIRYAEKPEAGKPPAIGTIYIQKWALPEPTPKSITVTVDV